jgi:hypothetical protein
MLQRARPFGMILKLFARGAPGLRLPDSPWQPPRAACAESSYLAEASPLPRHRTLRRQQARRRGAGPAIRFTTLERRAAASYCGHGKIADCA